MSSQDSDGESYISHLVADPKSYGDLSPCGRTTDEEEDAHLMRINDSSSEEEDVPLPQPGDMHMEFKKSSLPDRAKKTKIESIPFCLLQENKQELCKKILSMEQKIDDLRDQNSVVKRKLRKKTTPSTKPSSSSPTKET